MVQGQIFILPFHIYRIAIKSGNSGKNKEFYAPSEKIRDRKTLFRTNKKILGSLKFCILSFQDNDFPYTQSHIQLSVTIDKFCRHVYHSVLCSSSDTQLYIF